MQYKVKIFIVEMFITLTLILLSYNQILKFFPFSNKNNNIHKTIYIDRTFSQEENEEIILAAQEWMKKTDNIVQFDIVELPTNKVINYPDALIFIKVTEDYPEVIYIDGFNDKSTLAYYSSINSISYIGVIRNRITDYDFKGVMLHEIGHALGLKHLKTEDGIGTLMYPTINFAADEITHKDLEQFCELYKCSSNVLKN